MTRNDAHRPAGNRRVFTWIAGAILAAGALPARAGLIHHFKLDESPAEDGAAMAAEVGPGPGTLHSNVAGDRAVAGKLGGAIHLESEVPGDPYHLSSYVESDGIALGNGDFTLAAWIYPDDTHRMTIFAQGGYCWMGSYVFDLPFDFNQVGSTWLATLRLESPYGGLYAYDAVEKGRWNHVAFTVDRAGDVTRLYVDAVEVASGSVWFGDLTDEHLAIGNLDESCHPAQFVGAIDDVRIYDHALSVEELESLDADTTPPEISCPPAVTAAASPTCDWSGDLGQATATDDQDPSPTVTNDAPAVFALGTTTVTWTATDDSGNSASCEQSVTVEDQTEPTIGSVAASPASLWPPNHELRDVTVTASASDGCSAPATCVVSSVSSNEPETGLFDDDKSPDWIVVSASAVRLRAERAGEGSGRIYTITVECTDQAGNTASATTTVVVPRNQK